MLLDNLPASYLVFLQTSIPFIAVSFPSPPKQRHSCHSQRISRFQSQVGHVLSGLALTAHFTHRKLGRRPAYSRIADSERRERLVCLCIEPAHRFPALDGNVLY